MTSLLRKVLSILGIAPSSLLKKAVEAATSQQGLNGYKKKLEDIVPDVTEQYNSVEIDDPYIEAKVRCQQAFQIRMVEKAVRMLGKDKMTVVDIGDSSGNHLIYMKQLMNDIDFRTISVNLDKKAVDKIKSKGMEAIHCAAEDLDLGEVQIDLFLSFQMVEHLMNPCQFFRNLAVKGKSDYMLVTLPYREVSKVGFWTYLPLVRSLEENSDDLDKFISSIPHKVYAEDEHIFELSPIDWKLLMLFSGWKPLYDEIYYQYPKWHPLYFAKNILKKQDFEGFWGVILKRDLSFSNIYNDWPS